MKTLTLIAGLVMAAGTLAAQLNQLTPDEQKAGWELLFDGKTFANWEDPAAKGSDSFVIEDNCLKAVRQPRFQEDLFTTGRFRDFELLFEWRIAEGGNSGVKYRIQDRIWVKEVPGMKFEDTVAQAYQHRSARRPDGGQQYVVGFEYQCIDNQRNPDGRLGGSHASGALYDFVAPLAQSAKPVGQFNRGRIVVRGTHLEHWHNSIKVVDTDLKSPAIAEGAARRWGAGSKVADQLTQQPLKDCRISLQNHNGEAWFRNIKIR